MSVARGSARRNYCFAINGSAGAKRSSNVNMREWWTAANEAEIPAKATASNAIAKTKRRM